MIYTQWKTHGPNCRVYKFCLIPVEQADQFNVIVGQKTVCFLNWLKIFIYWNIEKGESTEI